MMKLECLCNCVCLQHIKESSTGRSLVLLDEVNSVTGCQISIIRCIGTKCTSFIILNGFPPSHYDMVYRSGQEQTLLKEQLLEWQYWSLLLEMEEGVLD